MIVSNTHSVQKYFHMNTVDNNILPPFILIEATIEVNAMYNIHVKNPSVEDHEIYIKEARLQITFTTIRGIIFIFILKL